MFKWFNRLLGRRDARPSTEARITPRPSMGATTIVDISPTLAIQLQPKKTMAELTNEGRTELRTCMSCHERTPVPTGTPPFGIPLICQHCHAPLISVGSETDSVPPERVQKVFGYWNCCLVHAACPWCRKTNYAITAPANCRIGGYADREPKNPNAVLRLQIDCVHCGREFWMEWD